jgi:hypothetical protein
MPKGASAPGKSLIVFVVPIKGFTSDAGSLTKAAVPASAAVVGMTTASAVPPATAATAILRNRDLVKDGCISFALSPQCDQETRVDNVASVEFPLLFPGEGPRRDAVITADGETR